jgi:hypothetical protein
MKSLQKQRSTSMPREARCCDRSPDPERIKEYYLGAEVQTDWQVGSPITFKGEWEGKSYEDKGEILRGRARAQAHLLPVESNRREARCP